MQPSRANLLGVGGDEAEPDLRLATGYQRAALLGEDLSVEQPGPKGRHRRRVGHVEGDRFQPQSHLCTLERARGPGDRFSVQIEYVAVRVAHGGGGRTTSRNTASARPERHGCGTKRTAVDRVRL